MQYQMSGAAASVVKPEAPVLPAGPRQAVPKPPRNRKILFLLFLIAVSVAAGVFVWWRAQRQQSAAQRAQISAVRSAAAGWGTMQRTIRLSGTTAAQRSVLLIAPRLRGSRGDRGRSGRSGGTGGGSNTQVASTAGSTGSGSSPTTPTVSSTGTGAGQTGSAGQASGGSGFAGSSGTSSSGAFRSATSRFGGTTGSSRRSASSTSSQRSSLVTADTGSTSSQLPGGGGGGGGGGDFSLVLQQLIKPGSQVKKGDVLAEFDRQYMLLRLDDYRVSVDQQGKELVTLKANLDVARKAHEQKIVAAKGDLDQAALDLKTLPVRSAIDSERLRLAHEEALARYKQLLSEVKHFERSQQAQYRIAELDFRQSQLELQQSEANANRMVANAPIDGLTVMQNTFRGTEFGQIQEGDQLRPGQPYMQVVDVSAMVIEAKVSQVDVEHLRIGAKAVVRFDAYPDLVLPARVFSIGAMTNPGGMRASFVREIAVKLRLEELDPRVIPDLSVSADVVIETASEPSTLIARESVFRDSRESHPYVFVRAGTAWVRRNVELGLANNTSVAVTSGLEKGEVVALSRPPAASKGQ